jgi:hypothetical protein
MEGFCEYIEYVVVGSQQRVVLERGDRAGGKQILTVIKPACYKVSQQIKYRIYFRHKK